MDRIWKILHGIVLLFILVSCFMPLQAINEQKQQITNLQSRIQLMEETPDYLSDAYNRIIELSKADVDKKHTPNLKIQEVCKAEVTAYSAQKKQTDGDPHITASTKHIKPGYIAVSRDLFKRGWTFGKKVYVEGEGVFEIQDLMHSRFKKRLDIYFVKNQDAKEFGVQQLHVALLI